MLDSDIVKDIEHRKYKACYLVYNRKSTYEPDNQQNSLDYQKNRNIKYILDKKLKLADITLNRFCANCIIF